MDNFKRGRGCGEGGGKGRGIFNDPNGTKPAGGAIFMFGKYIGQCVGWSVGLRYGLLSQNHDFCSFFLSVSVLRKSKVIIKILPE